MLPRNSVNIRGNLATELETRFTAVQGVMVATARVAVQRPRGRNAAPDAKPTTDFFNIRLWGDQADLIVNRLEPGTGDFIDIEGRLRTDTWGSEDDRHERTFVEVDQFNLIRRKGQTVGSPPASEELPDHDAPLSPGDEEYDPATEVNPGDSGQPTPLPARRRRAVAA